MLNFTKEFKEIKVLSAVFWYIVSIIIVVFISFVLYITKGVNLINNDNLLSLMSTTLFIIILLYKFRINKNKLLLLFKDYIKKINIKELTSILATQLCLSMGISCLLIGIVYFTFPNILNELLNQSPVEEASTYGGIVISMLITVICAPIMEELFFRVIIFKRISKKSNVYIGMIVSSLIFGFLHIELAIIGAFLFGIACCILYIKYKNILIPMTVHFFNNLIASLPSLDVNATVDNSPFTNSDAIFSLSFGLVLFLIGMFFFIKFILKNKKYLKVEFSHKIDSGFTIEN